MKHKRPVPKKKRSFWFTWGAVGIVTLGIIIAAGGFTYGASQEAHDPFCASCHTEPETTFVGRSTATQAVDLASYHTAQQTRCIDCHSGAGVTGRIQAEMLGARNMLAWYMHTAVQPAKMTYQLQDGNCLKCHQDVVQRGYTPKQTVRLTGISTRGGDEAGPNHWHELMASWQTRSATAGTCASCHLGHSTDGDAQSGFEVAKTTRAQCDACHQALRGRERG